MLDAAGKAGALAGHRGLRGLRQVAGRGQEQLQPRLGLASTTSRRRPRRHPGRMGHLLRLRLHELQHAVRGSERHGHRRRPGVRGQQLQRHQESRRQLLQGERSDQQHRGARTRRAARCRSTRTSPRRGSKQPVLRPARHSAIPARSTRRPRSTWTSSTRAARTSAGVPALNQRDGNPAGPRHYSVLLAPYGTFSPASFTIDISNGRSVYDGMNVGIRRRMKDHLQFNAWYSLSRAKATSGNGADESSTGNIQDHLNPFGDVQFGPAGRTDSRHRATISAIIDLPMGFHVAPIWRYRSALPVATIARRRPQSERREQRHPDRSIRLRWVEQRRDGEVEGSRRVHDGQLRPRRVAVGDQPARDQVVPPDGQRPRRGDRRGVQPVQRLEPERVSTSNSSRAPSRQRTRTPISCARQRYSGDFQQPEQRIGQFGFRFSF